MQYKPRQDYVLVKPDSDADRTEAGIILPATVEREKPQSGIVIAVGPGSFNAAGTFVKTELEPGTHVLFGTYAGTELTVDGVTYLMLRERDVMLEKSDGDSDG